MVFHFFTTLKALSFNSRQYQEYVIFFLSFFSSLCHLCFESLTKTSM